MTTLKWAGFLNHFLNHFLKFFLLLSCFLLFVCVFLLFSFFRFHIYFFSFLFSFLPILLFLDPFGYLTSLLQFSFLHISCQNFVLDKVLVLRWVVEGVGLVELGSGVRLE